MLIILKKRLNQIKKIFSTEPEIVGLNILLHQFTDKTDRPQRIELFRKLLVWFTSNGSGQVEARFRFFFNALEAHPEFNQGLATNLNQVLGECRSFQLFTEVGLKVEHGLWGDLARRLTGKIFSADERLDIAQIISGAFPDPENVEAQKSISAETLKLIFNWLRNSVELTYLKKLNAEKKEAICFLAAHAAHYGLSSELQKRVTRPNEILESPFFKLIESSRDLTASNGKHIIQSCETEVKSVYAHLDKSGVSVDVVNRLETIDAILNRIQTLLELENATPEVLNRFLSEVIEAQQMSRAVYGYLGRHFYLLARKIVERNGNSGEHYIARSAAELRALFFSALGGGAIVVIMTILKIYYVHLQPPPLFLATGIWIIYSGGFLAMQFSGSTLATKIPSFTAARLAGYLISSRQVDQQGFKSEVRSTLSSQALALLGNICGVIPLALALDQFLRFCFGTSFMDVEYAHHVIESMNPVLSGAIFLGALTGFQLWLSSLAGGWFENWAVYKNIPQLVRENHHLRKNLGEQTTARISDWIVNHSSGLGTNIALGFLFGFTPLIGQLFGLNLNGHHVTIATASTFFAFSSLQFNIFWPSVLATVSGLFLIGFMNFVVSFSMALFIAASARRMHFWRMVRYLRSSFSVDTQPVEPPKLN